MKFSSLSYNLQRAKMILKPFWAVKLQGTYIWWRGILSFFLLLVFLPSFSQPISNARTKTFKNIQDTLFLDSLSLIPASVEVFDGNNQKVNIDKFEAKYSEGFIILGKDRSSIIPPIKVYYKVFPYAFAKAYSHKALTKIEPDKTGLLNPFVYTYKKENDDFFRLGGINKSGSISRGVSFGNNQDVIVNSSLDLKLAGKVSEEVSILAAITDDNIPIQPDGNTQQIQEFDKVFIQLYDKNNKLIVGDFELKRPNSYFMNFYKKAQGANFSSRNYLSDPKANKYLNVSASTAISKGKFARNTFNGIEGNQGPYKLIGSENELYIIILSGTEKVYIDGERLVRGQDQDYVIDYNTAEISFTPIRLITKDKRIVVEFQYSDRNYTRSLIFSSADYHAGRLNLNVSVYSEQDAKNQPIDQDLDVEQKQLLSEIGDNLDSALVPRIDSVGFSELGVLYKKMDSLGYRIYQFSPDSGVFQVSFSNVGQGNGNYMQDINTIANGRVFKWVAPDTINGSLSLKGDYEPITKLATPKQNQMLTISGSCQISERTKILFEAALTNNDLNKFSTKDDNDNIGIAYKVGFQNEKKLNNASANSWSLLSSLTYEQVEKRFKPIERFRKVEFERNWNLDGKLEDDHEYIPGIGLELFQKDIGFIRYKFNSFIKGEQYLGMKNHASIKLQKDGWATDFVGSYLETKTAKTSSAFIRSKGRFSKQIKRIVFGLEEEQENNLFIDLGSDSLLDASYSFYDWTVFVKSPDTTKNKMGISYGQRTDLKILSNSLKEATLAENFKYEMTLFVNAINTLNGMLTYRKLTIKDSLLASNKPDESLLSRLEHRLNLAKGAITSTAFYEIGSGMEVKKEFYYQELVAKGQGVYEWIDRDSNGIESLDEFEIAAFQYNANYIKVFVPTNDYIKTYSNMFSEVLNLRPSAVWRNATGLKKLISRFSNQTALRIARKTTNNNLAESYNPFKFDIDDTTLVSLNSTFRNILYFNRTHPKFGLDLKYLDSRNRALLVNGIDTRGQQIKSAYLRWNITRQITWNILYALGEKSNYSEFFSSKDYQVHQVNYEPKITYQPNTKLRFSLSYSNKTKENLLLNSVLDTLGDTLSFSGGEIAVHHKIGFEIKKNTVSKGSFLARVDYIGISYKDVFDNDAAQNTSVGFEMLEGLQIGSNFTWSLSYQQNLSGNMQMSITYDGKQSEDIPIVHRGGVQLRAFF